MAVKLAAEQGLALTNLDWVALRLVLVYGPGVQGNMARLAELARSPIRCRSRASKPSVRCSLSTIWWKPWPRSSMRRMS